MKKYLPLTNGQELEVEVWYNRDGVIRGYYLSVKPVERGNGMIGYMLYSGTSKLVKRVTRKSAKAEREACEAAALIEAELIAYVLQKEELALEEVAAQ